jgi:hypothetical protein
MAIQNLRSSQAHRRAIPSLLSAGQICINTNEASPGLFFKDSNGDLVKVGPVHIGTSAPNSSPDSLGAGSLVTGTVYQILTVGSSDFTAVGASANTVGTIFTATGTTTGTGTVSTGVQGNEKGEQWLDTTGGAYDLKIYDGSAWRSQAGEFVNVTGDTMTGVLQFVSGSASAPGIAFSGDTNTGIFRPAADSVAVTTGGTQRITVDSSGRLLVGTTTEGASSADNLTIADSGHAGMTIRSGSNHTGSIYFSDATSGGGEYDGEIAYNQTSRFMKFATAQTERMRIDSSGNVGIGTQTPQEKLEIQNGLISVGSSTNTSSTNTLITGYGYILSGTKYGNTSIRSTYSNSNNSASLEFYTASSGTATTERMRIDSSGRVGIGTDSPSQQLTIKETGGQTQLSLISDTDQSGAIYFGDTASTLRGVIEYNHTSDFMRLYTSGSERMRIDSSGRLLVGTTTEGFADVADNFTIADSGNCGMTIRSGSSNVGSIYFSDATSGSGEYDGYIDYQHSSQALRFGTNAGTERMRITSDGKVGVGTSSPSATIHAIGNVYAGANIITTNNTTGLNWYNNIGLLRIQQESSQTGYCFDIYKGGTNAVKIGFKSDGSAYFASNVGIGTQSPSSRLHIYQTGSTQAGLVETNQSASVFNFKSTGQTAGQPQVGCSASNLILNTNAAERMRITSAGRVGVGTSSPQTKMEIVENAGGLDLVTPLRLSGTAINNDDGWKLQFYNNTASVEQGSLLVQYKTAGSWKTSLTSTNNVTFDIAGNERVRIDSSGNVLFGKTSQNLATAGFQHRGDAIGLVQITRASGEPLQLNRLTNDGKLIEFRQDTTAIGSISVQGSDLGIDVNGGERLRIDSSGNVAIGTSSALQSAGFTGVTASGSTGGIYWFAKAGAQKGYIYGQDNDVTLASTDASGVIRLLTGGNNERLRITSDGKVGIGSTTPAANLDVLVNSASDSEIRVRNNVDGLRLMTQADGTQLIRSVFNRGLIFGTGTSTVSSTFKEAFRVDGSQRLLVGTSSTPTGPNTQYTKLGVFGNSSSATTGLLSLSYGAAATSLTNDFNIGRIFFGDTGAAEFGYISCEVDGTSGSGDYPGRLVFATTADAASTPTERMRIDSSGRVGIGTTSPGSYSGAATQLSIAATGNSGLNIVSGTSNTGIIRFADGTSGDAAYRGRVEYMHDVDALMFGTAGAERIRITSAGNLAIGTTLDGSERLNVVGPGHNGHGTANVRSLISYSHTDGNSMGLWFGARTDETTGIIGSRTATGNIAFETYHGGWEERMRITNTGRVGIGTQSPGHKLVVEDAGDANTSNYLNVISGNAANAGIAFGDTDTDLQAGILYLNSDNALRFFKSGFTEAARIDSSGRLGLGTTSPDYQLCVEGTGVVRQKITCTNNHAGGAGVFMRTLNAGSTVGSATILIDNTGNFKFFSGASSESERMRIDSAGRLLVGTSSGQGQFIVQSNLPKIQSNYNGTKHVELGIGSGGCGFAMTTGHFMTFNHQPYANRGSDINLTERMRIDSSGNVKIGTTADGAGAGFPTKIVVSGADASIFKTTGVGATSAYPLRVWHDATTGNNLLQSFAVGSSYVGVGTITYNRSTNRTQYNTTSDARLKTNITDASSALSDLGQVRVRSFDWIEEGHNRVNYGFVAQELNNIAPYAVSEGDYEDEVIQQWGVSESSMVPLLTKALQEAIAKIETLEQRLSDAGIA